MIDYLRKTLMQQLKTIGWMAMLLPFLAAGFAWIFQCFPDSISETYHMCSKPFLIGILTAASFYMISYKGYDKTDKILMILSGIFGFGIVLFPCTTNFIEGNIGFLHLPQAVSGTIHNISAICFFLLQTYMIGFQFTKGKDNPTKKKKKRNKIYKGCAIAIVLSTILLVILNFFINIPHFVWVAEVVPLICLGLAYTTKSESWKYLNDDK